MKKKFFIGAMALLVSATTFAGGLLTNTNQNATYLRNPARDAAIAIDGVYSNPAGVAFLPEGFHLSLSWQAAAQKRQMNATNLLFMNNTKNPSKDRFFEGETFAPVIPSFQAAYIFNDKWSVSAQFAVGGGGGACEFANGLPMFEELIGGMAYQFGSMIGSSAYSLDQNLTGKQYFFGLQVGGTYKIADMVSVFGGLRTVMAKASYVGAISNINIGGITASSPIFQQMPAMAQYAALLADYKLDCNQSDFGFTPIVGVDVNLGKLNLAAKYEFRTKIAMENEANNSANLAALASQIPAVAVYGDGNIVRSDIPAYLALGAQYSFDKVRIGGGYHYFWDKDAKGSAIKAGDNSWEVVLGAEWDIADRWTISCGGQRTELGFADSDMSDTNFSTSSYGLSIGAAFQINDMLKLNAGYLHSMFDDHEFTNANGTACNYTRKSDAFGVSLDFTF